jgi:hypothetical protein
LSAAAEGAAGLSAAEAVIKAADIAVGKNIFNRHQLAKDESIRPNHFRRVEILSERQPDGLTHVLFSLPISSRIVSQGRMATRELLEVRFSGAAPDIEAFAADQAGISKEDDARFCQAVASVLRHRKKLHRTQTQLNGNRIEFAVAVSKRENGELFVNIERIAYLPGGHTGYLVSAKDEVLRVFPGR